MTPITVEKSFREWTRLDLEDYVGLQYVEQLPALDNWLSTEISITEDEKRF